LRERDDVGSDAAARRAIQAVLPDQLDRHCRASAIIRVPDPHVGWPRPAATTELIMHDELPRRTERLVKWSLAPWERAAVLGDMQEEFHYLSHASGHRLARRWYWRQSALS